MRSIIPAFALYVLLGIYGLIFGWHILLWTYVILGIVNVIYAAIMSEGWIPIWHPLQIGFFLCWPYMLCVYLIEWR